MNTIIMKLTGAAVAAAAFGSAAVRAAEPSPVVLTPVVMAPLKGLSFDVGSKHAVAYFKPAGSICNLTMAIAEQPSEDDTVRGSTLRVSVAVEAGKTARIDTAEGKALVFACETSASAMTVKAIEQVAWTPRGAKS